MLQDDDRRAVGASPKLHVSSARPATWPCAQAQPERRIVALDGVRGLMTIFVLVSHYFAELPGGLSVLAYGWVAVDMFFVLSGFLVGRLILEKGQCSNFYTVFYIRRACRTFPIYFACVIIAMVLFSRFASAEDQTAALPVWSYLTFCQNILMVSRDSIGWHWLAPTWTLAVEEQFYLFAPALMLLTPRRALLPVLAAIMVLAVGSRVAIHGAGLPPIAASVLLPTRADNLICGLIASVLTARRLIHGTNMGWRIAPVALLVVVIALNLLGGTGTMMPMIGHFIVSVGCGCFLISLIGGAPEAERFHSPVLRFFGTNSYAIYLTHLPILWLMHRLLLGSEPAITDLPRWGVTLLALPVCLCAAWILTRVIEEPITAFGRSWRWGPKSVSFNEADAMIGVA